ncbi:MAG: hypothetical protein CNE98_04295 [Bacteroidetes bacterium MED-G17]|nr:MAG: hypothetical protein CBB99_03410 [Bacteroidetes bacterium TMED39]PDH52586.1 MAG: hypothetical protein CNE98_04295 [Bacteroidetes bacterium MED-G17]CAI8315893.1 MAG: Type III pantothenate kinase [Bacteroidetes bacterium MED-G17]|tara:strand:- start:12658 stop:13371 length:714 start_codon:yes stop_codon:yes gene_type:complete
MLLGIDEGNTNIKVAQYSIAGKINQIKQFKSTADFFQEYSSIDNHKFLVCSSRSPSLSVIKRIQKKLVFELNDKTQIPFSSKYQTNELGADRIAGIYGAMSQFSAPFILVSIGTCITYNLVNSENVFLGGGISPGIGLRLRSMYEFTGRLPQIDFSYENTISKAHNTKNAMLSGALEGILLELDGWIETYQKEHDHLKIIFTGGDAQFFEKLLKKKIFVRPNLNFVGLYSLYKFDQK